MKLMQRTASIELLEQEHFDFQCCCPVHAAVIMVITITIIIMTVYVYGCHIQGFQSFARSRSREIPQNSQKHAKYPKIR